MNRIIIVLSIFLLLIAGFVFYQLSQNRGIVANGKVTIGEQTFDVAVVKDDKDKQIGLTKYSSIKENQGMLFVFDSPQNTRFWMKNMKFPIDIIFINDKTIISIVQNAPIMNADEEPVYYSSDSPANYVLEINADLVEKYNIKKGDTVTIETTK